MHGNGLLVPPVTDRLSGEVERLSAKWGALKKPEGSDSAEAVKKAAQEFESLFVNYLIKTMQDTVGESGLFGQGLGAESYRDMMFQELSRRLTQGGGIGLAKQLMESLRADAKPAAPAEPPPAPAADSDETFILPVRGRQTSSYGVRPHPMDGHRHFHRGIDLAAPQGSPILAARSGKVVFSGYQKGYGNTVVIDHEDGYRTRYAHLQTRNVAAGDFIAQGDPLGRVGRTGRATGPHLHFEISRNNVPVNPRDLL